MTNSYPLIKRQQRENVFKTFPEKGKIKLGKILIEIELINSKLRNSYNLMLLFWYSFYM